MLPTCDEGRKIFERIRDRMSGAARSLGCAICYGTIGWTTEGEEKYRIRQVVVDDSGDEIASYDKIHLCDYGDCAETRFFDPGNRIVSFEHRGWRFGLLVCADMRYPTLCRRLAKDHLVDALVQPACFARDISFRTWDSFREARAVENGCYYLAANYAGTNFGSSSAIEPWVDENHEPVSMGCEAGFLTVDLERSVLERARAEFPFHRALFSDRDRYVP